MNKTIMKCVFGSHMYGLSTPQSDTDYKGIFIPSADAILAQKAPRNISNSTGSKVGKNTADDVDTEMFSLHEFINLACKGETVAIDMLHCPNAMLVEGRDIWKYIQDNRHLFYTTNMSAYIGYVRKQAAKYGVKGTRLDAVKLSISDAKLAVSSLGPTPIDKPFKIADIINLLPEDKYRFKVVEEKGGIQHEYYQVLEKKFQLSLKVDEYISILRTIYDSYGSRAKMAMDNEGIDWKAVSHAVRAGEQILEIYTTGDLVYPLKNRDFILDVKLGKLDFTSVVKPHLESIVEEVERLSNEHEANGTLPKNVDRKIWDELIEQVYGEEVMKMMQEKYRYR